MALKYVEQDADFAKLLHSCLQEVASQSNLLERQMSLPHAFIFVSSPKAVTPYHMDPEHNFLLQIRGSKQVHLFDPNDPDILSQEVLTRFYSGAHRNLVFKERWIDKAKVFDLAPGQGLHFPATAPHFVQNGDAVSVSLSITFRTPKLDRTRSLYRMNLKLSNLGLHPQRVGQSPRIDRLKFNAYRVWRRINTALGKEAP